MNASTPILLDTDIGDDIDDALALGLILASPELRLVGITTVFGNVTARARQALTILRIAGGAAARVPVAVGCSRGMTTVPHSGLLKTFADPNRLPNQDSTCLPQAALPPIDPRHGVDLIIDTVRAGNGDVLPVMIGAMTNLALAMVKEPAIIPLIPRIAVMAGEFRHHKSEWNILCDAQAAAVVFGSGVPVQLIPWYVGDVVQFRPEDVARLDASDDPVCRRLSAAVQAWQADRRSDACPEAWPVPRLYDPMAVATLIRPNLCTWKTGTVRVELTPGHTFAYTTFQEHADGPHRVAWDADRSAGIEFFLDRVLGGPAESAVLKNGAKPNAGQPRDWKQT